jgi:hypothetical protein
MLIKNIGAKCRLCLDPNIEFFWKIVESSHGDAFKDQRLEAISQEKVSLTLGICKSCGLLQILETFDIKSQYRDYLYKTSNTNALSNYYERLSRNLIYLYQFSKNDLIIDIGSNDGTFLKFFKTLGYSVIGIEPSTLTAHQANADGIKTINSFFDKNSVQEILKLGKIGLISINYTIANVPNLEIFFENLIKIMNEDTIVSIVTGYHPDQFEVKMFDYVGHDHLSYLSLTSLSNLCKKFGLKIFSAERIEHKGGSIHVLLGRSSSRIESNSSVKQLIQREKWLDIENIEYHLQFKKAIKFNLNEVKEFIGRLGNTSILGVGASISTSYLIKTLDLGKKISYLFDDDLNKIGKFSPNYGIEVKPLSDIGEFKGKPVLLLAWQHTDKLLERLEECGYVGKIIIPFPKLKVIN